MKFDLTKEIQLKGKDLRNYRILQFAVYLLALGVFFGVAFLMLFPSYSFYFNFSTPDSKKNSITNLQKEDGKFISQGKVTAEKTNSLETSLAGAFSNFKISFWLNKKDNGLGAGKIQIRKGFKAFFSPIDSPRGFNDGSLLKNGNNYYIVSDKNLRKFENVTVLENLGFSKEAFPEVSADELRFNPEGDLIRVGDDTYPNSTTVSVNGEYYIFNGGKLDKFLSENAYLSRFSKEQAIIKDETFFVKHPISSTTISFANGSLIAYGESAFIVEGENILPIESAETFLAFGFNWNDLIQVNGDEFSFYQKGNLFKIDGTHPTDTVFQVQESGQFYLYENQTLHLLSSENAMRSWSKKVPVVVSEKSLTEFSQCNLEKSGIIFPKYFCATKINDLATIPGKDYKINFSFAQNTNIDSVETILSKDFTWENLRLSIGEILRKIKLTYVK